MAERPRVVDPSRCWVRHVARAPAGTTAPFRCTFDDPLELNRWRRGTHATNEAGVTPPPYSSEIVRNGSVLFTPTYHTMLAPGTMVDGTVDAVYGLAPTTSAFDYVDVVAKSTDRTAHVLVQFNAQTTPGGQLVLWKMVGGTYTQLAAGPTVGATTAGDYRLRLTTAGNVLTAVLLRESDGSIVTTVTYTLTGSDATAFGAGVAGRTGVRVVPVTKTSVALRSFTRTRTTDDLEAWDVGGGAFKAQPLGGVNGRQGWVRAQLSPTLSDDGDLSITFPNAAGDDGVQHRSRFALLTDPNYRPGEEWIEVYREPGDAADVLMVGTPTKWKIDGSTLELTLADAWQLAAQDRAGVLDGFAHPPHSVFEHYSRLTRAHVASSFLGVTNVNTLPDGWVRHARYTGIASGGTLSVDAKGGGVHLSAVGGTPTLGRDLEGVYADDFELYARVRLDSGSVLLESAPASLGSDLVYLQVNADGSGALNGLANGLDGNFKLPNYSPGGMLDLRLVFLRRFVYAYVNGELVVVAERPVSAITSPAAVLIEAGGELAVESAGVNSRQPILGRGATRGDYRTPGQPTPGGLHGYYYDLTAAAARYAAAGVGASAFGPVDEVKVERLDAIVSAPSAGGQGNGWQPAGVSQSFFATRWVGSIYLDLSAGRALQLANVDYGVRVYVGHRRNELVGGEYVAGGGTLTGEDLRSWLGPNAVTGWYPIVIEYLQINGGRTIDLRESALDASGAATGWTVVPATKLSPYGCVVDTYRRDSNRDVLKAMCDTFGYQAVCEPRSLESGELPGQLVPRLRAGRDTDYAIDSLEGTSAAVEGDATDAVDRLVVDAAGIADPTGSGQLAAEGVVPGSADAHVFLSSAYESLSEINDPGLLQQRLGSMLALRATPNLQAGVVPRGTRELVDTFPLTGQLARLDWRPGDGVRLKLPELGVDDLTPRQIVKPTIAIVPDGLVGVSASFRQRPRDVKSVLRKLNRTVLSAQRNYQGGIAILTGSLGATTGAPADIYSRLALPADPSDVILVEWVVTNISGGPLTLYVNGQVTAFTGIGAGGRYDVTRYLTGGSSYIYAHMVAPGGTGAYEGRLEARVRV